MITTTKTTEPIVNTEKGYEFYNGRYKYGYEWSAYIKLGEEIIQYMKILGLENSKILDVGCGVGWFTNYIYFNISKNVKGIDFSNKAIWFHAKRLYPSIDFKVADLYKYKYEGNEVYLMMEVMEHIDDIKLLKMLPKDSKIFITVPYKKERMDISHLREYDEINTKERYKNLLDIKANLRIGQFLFIWGIKK